MNDNVHTSCWFCQCDAFVGEKNEVTFFHISMNFL